MKTVALTILGLCCVMSGQYIAYRYSMRVVLLEKCLVMLKIIETSISFLEINAKILIDDLSRKDELKALFFLQECNSQLKAGIDFESAWKNSLNKRYCFQPLKKEDIEVLQAFSMIFGKTDTDGQITNCRVHSALLNEKLNDAKAEQARYSSVCTIFGVLSGICVFIIFI